MSGLSIFFKYFIIYRWYFLSKLEQFSWISFTTQHSLKSGGTKDYFRWEKVSITSLIKSQVWNGSSYSVIQLALITFVIDDWFLKVTSISHTQFVTWILMLHNCNWICFHFICMLLLCLCLFDLCTLFNLYIFLVKLYMPSTLQGKIVHWIKLF